MSAQLGAGVCMMSHGKPVLSKLGGWWHRVITAKFSYISSFSTSAAHCFRVE